MEGFILANGWRDKVPCDYKSMAQEHVAEALRAQQVRKQNVIGLGFSWLSSSFLNQLSPQPTYI